MEKIKAFLPGPKEIVKTFIGMVIVYAAIQIIPGGPNLLANPVQWFKDRFSK